MKNHYQSPLLVPISVGSLKLKNRLITLPMGCMHADEHGAITGGRSERSIAYYEAKAKGGFSLLITEGIILDESTLSKENEFVNRIHALGAKVITQCGHPGRQITISEFGVNAPSPIPCPQYGIIPHELTIKEIKEIEAYIINTAFLIQQAGYDGVEVHGAHGYLIAEFMSTYANKRFDEYGGSLENRMRFPLEIIAGIREKCGNDFTLFFRISADEFVPGGRTIEETKTIAIMLEKAGVDCIDVSAAVYGSTDNFLSPMNKPVAMLANLSAEVKSVVNIPVIAGNRINHPKIAESLLISEKADLIGMGRASLADPELPNKFFSGNSEDIRICIGCNQGCTANLFTGNPVCCMVNPTIGYEYLHEAEKKAEVSKKVTVVGGGPAGMNAAIGAAMAGHDVTLYEKSDKLGGNFAMAPIPPEKGSMASLLQWQVREMNKLGVKVNLGTEFTTQTYDETKPEAVIIATGSVPSMPPISGIDKPHVVTAGDVLLGKYDAGRNVIVAGGGMVGSETATHLAMENLLSYNNRKVTVVEMMDKIAGDEEITRRTMLLQLMNKQNITVMTSTKIVEIKDTSVVLEKDGTKTEYSCDTVVIALGYKADNALYEQLKNKPNVTVVGDAKQARNALKATREGFTTGINI